MAENSLTCPICGTQFVPRDTRQACCSKKCGGLHYHYKNREDRIARYRERYEKHRETISLDKRKRYAEDEQYRNNRKEWSAEYRAKNPEKVRLSKERDRNRPGEREKAAAKSREWHSVNKEHANGRRIIRNQAQRVSRPWQKIISSAKARAKLKGLPFDLTEAWARDKWNGVCELTKLPFSIGLRGSGAKLFSPSIDRIIPSMGYLQSNCRVIIFAVNAFKYDGDDDTMYRIAEALINNRPPTSQEEE